jgi:hypothetical protein
VLWAIVSEIRIQMLDGTTLHALMCSRLRDECSLAYSGFMIDPRLERYLELCQRIYERMEREGSWPWAEEDIPVPDSTLPEDLIDSESPHKCL